MHVRTLMTQMGIEALAPQPGTSERNPQHKVYPYLLRKLAIVRSKQVWVSMPHPHWPIIQAAAILGTGYHSHPH
uniref:Uncharacterized protein n=1 Tax=Curvibacter symbiont subsp. Hydra magnipapillata TaxID=667019 RepID=C9Y980_CURXX|nr:hypothetical protein Csp_A06810 [Curvibacter putative symbiont of Hydra magnipapillata]